MNQKINEQAFLLGKRQSLVGILTRAVAPASRNGPAVVILNTGIVHRVGHHRMYVTMSRALARTGHTVLRFDFSGIGDSDARIDALPLVESCMADIKEALDWLEREHQVSQVILIGLCSGADHAVLYGHTDDRIVALVLMDPTIPATPRYYLHYIARRLTRLSNWTNLLAGRSRILSSWAKRLLYVIRPELRSKQITLQDLQFHTFLEQSYQNTVDRHIKILVILTEETTRQTYAGQIRDAFPKILFGDLLRIEFFPGSDHLFTLEADRAKLIPLVLNWIDGATSVIRIEELYNAAGRQVSDPMILPSGSQSPPPRAGSAPTPMRANPAATMACSLCTAGPTAWFCTRSSLQSACDVCARLGRVWPEST